jgi:hypothetical protein
MTKEIVQINPIEVTDTFIRDMVVYMPNRPPAIYSVEEEGQFGQADHSPNTKRSSCVSSIQ